MRMIEGQVRIFGVVFFVFALVFLGVSLLFSSAVAKSGSATVRMEVGNGQQQVDDGFWDVVWRYLGVRGPSVWKPEPGSGMKVTSTAYAPSPYQTDSTPCITAAGTRVRRGTVASNFLPMGTLLEINNKVYIVEDRMNPRYRNSIDVFFASTSEALEFGRQELDIVIIGYGEPGQDLPGRGEKGKTEEKEKEKETKERFDKVSDESRQGEDLTLRERVSAGLDKVGSVFGNLMGARSYDVNRYDVDCF